MSVFQLHLSCRESFSICPWPTGVAFRNQNVASHCHVDCGSDTYFEGKLQRMPIVEVKQGLNQHHFLEPAGCLFFPHSEKGDQLHTKQKRPVHPWLLLHDRMRPLPLPNSIPTQQCCRCFFLHMPLAAIAPHTSPGQPHFASSEYLWMLLGVHIPLSGRSPGMGLPILSPCSRLSGGLALHPIAVCILPCLAATSVASVMEKNKRQKTAWAASGKQSSKKKKKKINAEERWMAFSRLQSLN